MTKAAESTRGEAETARVSASGLGSDKRGRLFYGLGFKEVKMRERTAHDAWRTTDKGGW